MRRLISGLMALLFLPAGAWTIKGAYSIQEAPHAFVMLIFSGSLMILVGLAGIVGLAASGRQPGVESGVEDGEEAGADDDDGGTPPGP